MVSYRDVELAQQPQQQSAPTLKLLQKELHCTVASKWEDIGIQLDIEQGLLDEVKSDNHGNSGSCLREMLKIWRKRMDPMPSWINLTEALICLGEEQLAHQLKDEYLC